MPVITVTDLDNRAICFAPYEDSDNVRKIGCGHSFKTEVRPSPATSHPLQMPRHHNRSATCLRSGQILTTGNLYVILA